MSVATGLKAVQPIFHIARAPAYLACANMAGAREAAISRPAIKRRPRFEASDVEHVSDRQELVSMGRHGVVLSFVGMQDVSLGGVESYSVRHSRKFMERKFGEKLAERDVNSSMQLRHAGYAKTLFVQFEFACFEIQALRLESA